MTAKVDEIIQNLDLDDIEAEYRLMLSNYKEELDKLNYDKLLWNSA